MILRNKQGAAAFKYLISSITLMFLASCNPLGELTHKDDDFCLGATLPDGSCRVDSGVVPSMSITATSGLESSDLSFTVSLSKSYPKDISVDYATSDGTATAGSDYTATTGSLIFTAGQTTKTITVAVTDDGNDENDETLAMTLSNLSKGSFTASSAVGTIVDNDGTPSLSINDVSVAENVGAGVATFTVTLSNASGQVVTVDYATSNGTATTADSDYTAASGTLSFNPGDLTKTFNVTINNDAKNEPDETFTSTLSNPSNASIFDATGTGTITNDDAEPSLSINDVSVAENIAGGVATFTVTLSAVSGKSVTVDYASSNGTATTADSDYTATSGALTFSAGETTKTFDVTITNDAKNEADETYTMTISNANNATISDATGAGTITNDDAVPSLAINDITVDEDDGTATFTVTQSAASGQTVTVDYASSNATATAGSDYVAASGTLTFNAGDTTKTFDVTITNDTSDEADETYTMTISNPSNASISDATGTGTITDNDVTVDQTDDDNTATGFSGGSHTGTTYSGGVLTLNATTNNAELDESWTPQWDNIVGYWKLNNDLSGTVGNNLKAWSYDGFNAQGKLKEAVQFTSNIDGQGIFSDDPNIRAVFAGDFTIGLWAKPSTSANGFSSVFITTGGTGMIQPRRSGASNALSVRIDTSTASNQVIGVPDSAIYDNQWHHIVLSISGNVLKVYIDGKLKTDRTFSLGTGFANNILFLVRRFHIGQYYIGSIDELVVWNSLLDEDEVALIYSRQSAKYTGEMKSRIIDSQSDASSWTNLDWITTLPFGKELPDGGGAANSESSADYTSLADAPSPYDGLMDGLVGLWHMNGAEGAIADDAVIPDASENGNDGFAKDADGTNTIAYTSGILAQAIEFDGNNDYIQIPLSNDPTEYTFSVWVFVKNISDSSVIYRTDGNTGNYSHEIRIKSNKFQHRVWDGSQVLVTSSTSVTAGKWYHLVATAVNSDVIRLYVNGLEEGVADPLGTLWNGGNQYTIARFNGGSSSFTGIIDELSIWSRALTADEILQLYRRGANRIKYQVRSCTSADCSDQNAATGDGWKGPGGNYLTYFSELYNNSSISSNCVIPQKCFASELSLDGDVQTESPSIRFDDFGADGIYMNNARYFQYRVIMESDDENTACAGGTTCMPELKSVEIGPAHTFEQ